MDGKITFSTSDAQRDVATLEIVVHFPTHLLNDLPSLDRMRYFEMFGAAWRRPLPNTLRHIADMLDRLHGTEVEADKDELPSPLIDAPRQITLE